MKIFNKHININKGNNITLNKKFEKYSDLELNNLENYLTYLKNKFNINFKFVEIVRFDITTFPDKVILFYNPNHIYPPKQVIVKNLKDILKVLSEEYPSEINANIFKQLNN